MYWTDAVPFAPVRGPYMPRTLAVLAKGLGAEFTGATVLTLESSSKVISIVSLEALQGACV